METTNKNNYKAKILTVLDDSTFGLTITEIADKTRCHRNTVSKYVNILEAEGLLNKKEISAARIYSSKKRKYLSKELVTSFLRGLVAGLKEKFPNKEQSFKEVGLMILDYFQFPLGNTFTEEVKRVKSISDPKTQLELFQEFYNYFDFFQDDIDISVVELQEKRIVCRLSNSEFLTDSFIYFFYVVCGITEGIYRLIVNIKVECNIENFNISKNKEESFIDISLEIK